MWNDRLRFAESIDAQWKALSAAEQTMVRNALETIDEDPISGVPLFEPFKGLWSYRAGHLRILYRIMPEGRFVVVLFVGRAAAR